MKDDRPVAARLAKAVTLTSAWSVRLSDADPVKDAALVIFTAEKHGEQVDPAGFVVGAKETSFSLSKSTGVRRLRPTVRKSKPWSAGACHTITPSPSPIYASTCARMRSRVRAEQSPTDTPARTSSSHAASPAACGASSARTASSAGAGLAQAVAVEHDAPLPCPVRRSVARRRRYRRPLHNPRPDLPACAVGRDVVAGLPPAFSLGSERARIRDHPRRPAASAAGRDWGRFTAAEGTVCPVWPSHSRRPASKTATAMPSASSAEKSPSQGTSIAAPSSPMMADRAGRVGKPRRSRPANGSIDPNVAASVNTSWAAVGDRRAP